MAKSCSCRQRAHSLSVTVTVLPWPRLPGRPDPVGCARLGGPARRWSVARLRRRPGGVGPFVRLSLAESPADPGLSHWHRTMILQRHSSSSPPGHRSVMVTVTQSRWSLAVFIELERKLIMITESLPGSLSVTQAVPVTRSFDLRFRVGPPGLWLRVRVSRGRDSH